MKKYELKRIIIELTAEVEILRMAVRSAAREIPRGADTRPVEYPDTTRPE